MNYLCIMNTKNEQQLEQKLKPDGNRYIHLLVLKLLSSIYPEGSIISSDDKDLVELVLHHGSIKRVSELKGLPYNMTQYRYTRAIKKLEEVIKTTAHALELQRQVNDLEKRLAKSENRLEKLGEDRKTLKYKLLKARLHGKDLIDEVNQNPEFTIRELKGAIKEYKVTISAKEKTITNLRNKYDSLKEDYDTLSKRLNFIERDYVRNIKSESDLKIKKEHLSDSVKELKEQLKTVNNEVIANRQEISRLGRKLRNVKDILDEKQKVIEKQQNNILALQKTKSQSDKINSLENRIAEIQINEKDLKLRINALTKELNNASMSICQQQNSYDNLLERIKDFKGIDAKDFIPHGIALKKRELIAKLKMVYDYKEQATKLWIDGLEADLFASRNLNKAQQAIIDELRKENEELRAQAAEPKDDAVL